MVQVPERNSERLPTIGVLGPLELRGHDGGTIDIPSKQLRRLLSILLINRGDLVTADLLATYMWPQDTQPNDPRSTLYTHISRLRTLLSQVPAATVERRDPGYRLLIAREAVDAYAFEDLVRTARAQARADKAVENYDSALSLWRGPAYFDFIDDDFARPEVARLDTLHASALDEFTELRIETGNASEVVPLLYRAAEDRQFQERPIRQLMIALYRTGRAADAIGAFQKFQHSLTTNLGIDPSEAMDDLYVKILRQDPSLDAPVSSVPHQPAGPAPITAVGTRRLHVSRNSFLGRDGDIATIGDLLKTRQLVTLVGVGGVGKTELAKRTALSVADRYAHGIVLCDLTSATDFASVVDIVASSVDSHAPADLDPLERVIRLFAGRSTLLVVDNCEQVLDPVAQLMDQLLSSNERLVILATSRERLGVDGEQVWAVEPLPVPEEDEPAAASELFIQRATAVNPYFRPPAAMNELCRRLAGIPLAIELAAARMNGVTVEEVLRMIEQPQRLRTTESGRPERHRSLHSVVDWSYRLLNRTQQDAFDSLSVFHKDFSLEAAVSVIRSEADHFGAADLVLDLVDRSLVKHSVVEGRSRYRLLDTLRWFAWGRLQDDPQALREVQERHARWYLRRAEELGPTLGMNTPNWMVLLGEDLPNLRAAFDWFHANKDIDGMLRLVVALHFYASCIMNAEIYEWVDRALAVAGKTDHPLLAATLGVAATGARLAGDRDEELRLAEAGVASYERHPHPSACTALDAMGDVQFLQGNFESAAEYYRRAECVAAEAAAEPHRLLMQASQGICMVRLGRLGEAETLLSQAAKGARRKKNLDNLAAFLLWTAELELAKSDVKAALARYRDAMEQARQAANPYIAYQILMASSIAEAIHGDIDRACTNFRALLFRYAGMLRGSLLFDVLRGMAVFLLKAGRNHECAVLMGAIPAEFSGISVMASLNAMTQYSKAREIVINEMGLTRFEAATNHGHQLTETQLVEHCLATIAALSGP